MDIVTAIAIALGFALIRLEKVWKDKTHNLSKKDERVVWKLINTRGEFTRDNVWLLFRFSPYYFAHKYITTHTVMFASLDAQALTITYAIVNNPYDKQELLRHTVTYTPETFSQLKALFTMPVFKHKYGSLYDIEVGYSYKGEVAVEADDVRNVLMILTYRIKQEIADTPKKRKMYIRQSIFCTVGEFKDAFYKTVEWKNPSPVNS